MPRAARLYAGDGRNRCGRDAMPIRASGAMQATRRGTVSSGQKFARIARIAGGERQIARAAAGGLHENLAAMRRVVWHGRCHAPVGSPAFGQRRSNDATAAARRRGSLLSCDATLGAVRSGVAQLMSAECARPAEYHRGSWSHHAFPARATNLMSSRCATFGADRMHAARSGFRHAPTRQGK